MPKPKNFSTLPETDSPAVNAEQEKKNKTIHTLVLDEEEQKRFNTFVVKIENAKRQRDLARVEFDGMTYEQDFSANKNAANAYLYPKQNDDEVRVVTGTTEKKIEVLSNEIASMNLQPEVLAHDQFDNELRNLGQDVQDIVKRTHEMEKGDDFDQSALYQLLTQRALYVQDVDEYITLNGRKSSKNSSDQPTPSKATYKPIVMHRARKILLSGLRVYLGDINIPARMFQTDQPYICIYTRRNYDEAKSLYGNWDRWKYVFSSPGNSQISVTPGEYRMHTLEANEIEEIKIYDAVNNEYYIILNGIPMIQYSTALPYEVLPGRRFPISMTIIKEMGSDFALGKPPVASAKTLQALNDETLRNLIRKFRQALEPPLGVPTSGKTYSKDIWEPGAVTQGIGQEDFSILNPENRGITNSEFALHDLIEKETEKFIGAGALQQGIADQGEQTATEIQTLQRNAIKNLGHIIAAYMRYKRDVTYLRIYNVIENFTHPVSKRLDPTSKIVQDVFERFTINDATLDDGTTGKKIIQFMDKPLTSEQKQGMFDFEHKEIQAGRPTRIRTINKKLLETLMIFWYVTVNSQQKDGSALSKILFKDAIEQAMGISRITGRQINPDKLVDGFENRWQFKDMFMRNAPQQGNNQNGGGEVSREELSGLSQMINKGERSATNQALTEGPKGGAKKPTLQQLMD